MRPDIADRPGARLRGVGAPGRLLARLGRREPALRVFHLHEPDVPQRPRGDPRPRLPYKGITGIGMGQHEMPPACRDRRGDGLGLRRGCGQRLVADDTDPGPQKGDGGPRVQVVRGDDRHRVDPVGPRRDPVHRPDEGAVPAAHHPQPQQPRHHRPPKPSIAAICARSTGAAAAKSSKARSVTSIMCRRM